MSTQNQFTSKKTGPLGRKKRLPRSAIQSKTTFQIQKVIH